MQEVKRARGWRGAPAGRCPLLLPALGSPCWDPELLPARSLCSWEPQAALAVCLSCPRPQPQQEQSCLPVAGAPAAPRNGDVCAWPLAALPRFSSDVLLSCQTLLQLNWDFGGFVSLGDGAEHSGPLWELGWQLWGCWGALQRLLCSPRTVVQCWPWPCAPLSWQALQGAQGQDSGSLCRQADSRLIWGWISLLST